MSGVYLREEEREGLRPTIGIRAATVGRSGKVTLMEDGILVAPPLRHGPQTTGGVINLRSTPIPSEERAYTEFVTDERGSTDVHAWHCDPSGDWSWLVETIQRDRGRIRGHRPQQS